LLVEDEESVRRSTCRILERSGYRVLEARTGDAASPCSSPTGKRSTSSSRSLYAGVVGSGARRRMRRDAPEIGCLVISGHAERFAKLTPEAGRLIVQSKPCRGSLLVEHAGHLAAGTAARRSAPRRRKAD